MTQQQFKSQKSLASFLDSAANRAEYIGQIPATSKQCWYLAGLMLNAGDDGAEYIVNTSKVLTKKSASQLISIYKD